MLHTTFSRVSYGLTWNPAQFYFFKEERKAKHASPVKMTPLSKKAKLVLSNNKRKRSMPIELFRLHALDALCLLPVISAEIIERFAEGPDADSGVRSAHLWWSLSTIYFWAVWYFGARLPDDLSNQLLYQEEKTHQGDSLN